MKIRLDVIQYTDHHVMLCVQHNITDFQAKFFMWLNGNLIAKTGNLYKFNLSDAIDQFGCKYDTVRRAIYKLNAAGLTEIAIRKQVCSGRVIGHAHARLQQDTDGEYPLRVGKFHAEVLKALNPHIYGNGTVKMRLLMLMGLHCDEETGILAEKQPEEWGQLLGKHRHNVQLALNFFNTAGIIKTETRVFVSGTLPFVQLAANFFKIDKARRKHGKEAGFTDEMKVALYKHFAINTEGWLKEQLMEAYAELVLPVIEAKSTRPR